MLLSTLFCWKVIFYMVIPIKWWREKTMSFWIRIKMKKWGIAEGGLSCFIRLVNVYSFPMVIFCAFASNFYQIIVSGDRNMRTTATTIANTSSNRQQEQIVVLMLYKQFAWFKWFSFWSWYKLLKILCNFYMINIFCFFCVFFCFSNDNLKLIN